MERPRKQMRRAAHSGPAPAPSISLISGLVAEQLVEGGVAELR